MVGITFGSVGTTVTAPSPGPDHIHFEADRSVWLTVTMPVAVVIGAGVMAWTLTSYNANWIGLVCGAALVFVGVAALALERMHRWRITRCLIETGARMYVERLKLEDTRLEKLADLVTKARASWEAVAAATKSPTPSEKPAPQGNGAPAPGAQPRG